MYADADGDLVEQEADVVVLACGAVETARLLLLSRSGRFPNGLANGSDLVGRNVTFHEYSAAVGIFDDPVYAWAGGGYVSASSFQFYEHDDSRGFASGGHIACAGVGIPLPINWGLPDRPLWGPQAKQMDRDYFNHSMAVAMVVHDMPQHDNRIELDEKVEDAWGLPVARVTLTPHKNDLDMGRFLIDRNAEILEAGGAKKVYRVYIDKVTGNCSHQHGTTRMGERSRHIRTEPVVPGPRRRQPVRRRRRPVPNRDRRKPDVDDDGERMARVGVHRHPLAGPGTIRNVRPYGAEPGGHGDPGPGQVARSRDGQRGSGPAGVVGLGGGDQGDHEPLTGRSREGDAGMSSRIIGRGQGDR